jgi:hydrogenase expression/formation protein HypE
MTRFRTGKIPSKILIRNVLRHRGSRDPDVIMGSSLGEDAALVKLDGRTIVLKTDPVTATTSDAGWLAVHINANDVACRGARPRWFLCDLLLPEGTDIALIDSIMRQIDSAAKKLGVAIVGGHTEVTPNLTRPIVVGYMVGWLKPGQKFITSAGARPDDDIIMTKSAGIEGTSLLATDFSQRLTEEGVGKYLRQAKAMRHSIGVVEDAMIATRSGGIHAMHDPTEGGLLQGVWEIAEASKTGFTVNESRIAIKPATEKICSALRVNPLRLLSSGCLLIAADKRKSSLILRRLRASGIQAHIIGRFTERKEGRRMVMPDGTSIEIGPSERDELYRVIETLSNA